MPEWTNKDAERLAELETAFENAGGRGVDMAEEIDQLRAKRDSSTTRILSLNRAGLLADLIRAVESSNKQSGVKLRYYPFGSDTDKPAEYVLRAFTHDGGGFLREDEDVRDAYVWCSGIFEHWFKVEELLDALDNTTSGRHGMDKPMAAIDFDKETS